jgi:hypothetical protein
MSGNRPNAALDVKIPDELPPLDDRAARALLELAKALADVDFNDSEAA